ncbi:MAG TPA: hypothetical protein VGR14_03340 [Verrucomicrobiae bacterium]|jgi:hypothetical protein|nr:hypothetical protein [Verrucomicrobiae bacterium]
MNEIGPTQAVNQRIRQFGAQAFLVVAVALIAGCASPDAANQIKNFSNAVALTASNSVLAYDLVEKEHFDAQFSRAVVNYDGVHFNPVYPTFMTPAELQVRLDILNGFTTYAAQLSALMGNPTLTNLDQDTTKLGQSLNGLNQQLVQSAFVKSALVTSNDVQIFTAAVNFLGNWIITRKAQNDAKAAIASMQKQVPAICQLLEKDFAIMHNQLTNDFTETERNTDLYLQTSYHSLDPIQRRTELKHLAALSIEMHKADATMTAIQSSVEKIEAAHQALDQAFTKDTSNVSSLINEASGEAQRVAAYYNSLRTNQ